MGAIALNISDRKLCYSTFADKLWLDSGEKGGLRTMEPLTQQKCTACTGSEPQLNEQQIAELRPQIPEWNLVEEQRELRLKRTYNFPDFKTALEFTNRVGDEAEKEGHHPALLTEWGKVTVSWWTHAIGGLHQNDFIMAAKTDQIASQFQ